MIQIGIDVCLLPEGPEGRKKTKVLSKGPDVARQLLEWLAGREVILSELQVILVPTGTCHEHHAYGLHEKGLRVVVASPARVRSFATGMGILTKNDRVDAHVLALYGALPGNERLLKRRDALREDLQRKQNRLEKLHVTRFSTHICGSFSNKNDSGAECRAAFGPATD